MNDTLNQKSADKSQVQEGGRSAVPCSPPCPHCGLPPGEKKAPVQGYQPGIPWSMHLRAYDAYCKRYGPQKALIEGWCRGGFGTGELDMFIPGWRDELLVLNHLKSDVAALRDALAQGIDSLQSFVDDSSDPGTGALSALYMMRTALGFRASKPAQEENVESTRAENKP